VYFLTLQLIHHYDIIIAEYRTYSLFFNFIETFSPAGFQKIDREFEIVKLVQLGLSSEQMAEKLFLSKHTINKHRNNILEKTGKANISDLIYELKELGIL
jgi:DNA-binding CsgD family transcriptional regulator